MIAKFSVVATAGLIVMAGFVSQASAVCMDAKGKIANNGQLDGTTLGIVALRLGKDKHKCGIIGKPQSIVGGPDFRHTVVCDNHAGSDEAQAQVTLNTRFLSAPTNIVPCPAGSPGGPFSFDFHEGSTPDPASARGAFLGITEEGSIEITGNFNCDGGIIMKFDGMFCFAD